MVRRKAKWLVPPEQKAKNKRGRPVSAKKRTFEKLNDFRVFVFFDQELILWVIEESKNRNCSASTLCREIIRSWRDKTELKIQHVEYKIVKRKYIPPDADEKEPENPFI